MSNSTKDIYYAENRKRVIVSHESGHKKYTAEVGLGGTHPHSKHFEGGGKKPRD